MLNPLKEKAIHNEKFDSIYRGTVVDVADPLKAGRVRIRVMPMFDGAEDAHLPWAVMCDPFMGGEGTASAVIPQVGANVFCFFENGDFRYPAYIGGAPAMTNGTPDIQVPALSVNQYSGDFGEPGYTPVDSTDNKTIRGANGLLVELDDTPDAQRIHLYLPNGTRQEMTTSHTTQHTEGDHYIISTGDGGIRFGGNGTISVGGNCNVKVSGTATVEASQIVIRGTCNIN